jgi:GH15 family glucan-1,4-alpha-glucosidase
VPGTIEDYAVVGDMHTLALIDRRGSVDWLCMPRFDSQSVFAALLGEQEQGRWLIAPTDTSARPTRRYREGTMILDTEWETGGGRVRVTDFMPPDGGEPALVRVITGLSGSVTMHLDLRLRFDYGAAIPWVRRMDKRLVAIAGPNMVVLDSPIATRGEKFSTVADFTVGEGDCLAFTLRWQPSHVDLQDARDSGELLAQTERFWTDWLQTSTYEGKYPEAVHRSLLTLKALTYRPTGGIVAAGTTSLPEVLGGDRNWDYRYCWLRDSTFTLTALLAAGFEDEASAWREWLLRAIAGDPSKLQIMYGVAGERRLPEYEVPTLPGYQGSAPVRVGNAAVDQRQLDVYGEVLDALYVARSSRLDVREDQGAPAMTDASWPLQVKLLDFLEGAWREPDEGLWEVRGGQQHFTHSKVMAWVGMDRAVRTLETFDRDGPIGRWRSAREEIKAQVMQHGYDADRKTFVQYYGSKAIDASSLLFPMVGFVEPDGEEVAGTVKAVEENLLTDGFVRRYDTDTGTDGLKGEEGTFLMCSFWLANNYAVLGRDREASALFERLLDLRNDVGLLAEEYDPKAKRQLGNVPQAFSHTALVNTAFVLGGAADGHVSRNPDVNQHAKRSRRSPKS